MACDSVERERTWLVRSLPETLPAGTPVREGALVVDGDVVVRVRQTGDERAITVAGEDPSGRTEVGWELSPDQFAGLWSLATCRQVEKVRHAVAVRGAMAHVDVFGGALEGLVLVAVASGSTAEDDAFVAPEWFGAEVSGDPRYATTALARHGVPVDPAAGRA